MPWTCPTCQAPELLGDDQTCPTCEAPKTSWTLVRETTRTFTISAKKFEVLRGASTEAWPPDDPRHEAEPLDLAERAPVMPVSAAAKVAERGCWPPARKLLRVRLYPKNHPDLTVKLTALFEGLEPQEHLLPFEGAPVLREDGSVDVLVLLVRGEGQVTFPGVHVVDVTEDAAVAPSIEVAALGKPAKELPTEADAQVWLSARFFDRLGRAPLAGWRLRVEGREATTDERGAVVLDAMPWQDLVVAFDEGEVSVPAVHHPDVLTKVCVRWAEPAAPGAAPPAPVEETPPEELLYPAWLPRPDDPETDELERDARMTGEWDDGEGLDLIVEAVPDDDLDASDDEQADEVPAIDLDLMIEVLADDDDDDELEAA